MKKLLIIFSLFYSSIILATPQFAFGFKNKGLCFDLPHNYFLRGKFDLNKKLLLIDTKTGSECFATTKRQHKCSTGAGTQFEITSLRPLNDCSYVKSHTSLAIFSPGKSKFKPIKLKTAVTKLKKKDFEKNYKEIQRNDCEGSNCSRLERDEIRYIKHLKSLKSDDLNIVFHQHRIEYRHNKAKPNDPFWGSENSGSWSFEIDGKNTVFKKMAVCTSPSPFAFLVNKKFYFSINEHCCNCGWTYDIVRTLDGNKFKDVYSDHSLSD